MTDNRSQNEDLPREQQSTDAQTLIPLAPMVRNALRRAHAGDNALLTGRLDGDVDCSQCNNVGVVAVEVGCDETDVGAWEPCPNCRSSDLRVAIRRVHDQWIAVRGIRGIWGVGGSPMEALLAMEYRTSDALSILGGTRYRQLPKTANLRVSAEIRQSLVSLARERGVSVEEILRYWVARADTGSSEPNAGYYDANQASAESGQ